MEFYYVEDVMDMLRVSESKAYKIIQEMNQQLREKGYFTIAGRVPKKYFNEKFYFDNGVSSKKKMS